MHVIHTVVANKKLTFRFHSTIVERCENENETVAERYGQKGDKRSFGRWETFIVSTMRTKIAVVACCAGSTRPLAGSQADSFFCSRRSLELLARNIPDNRQDTKVQLSFDVCYIIESARGLAVLLCHSQLPESLFLPRGIENGQLLQYGHAYQLSVCMNVKTMDAHARVLHRTAERCENGNVLTTKRSCNGTER